MDFINALFNMWYIMLQNVVDADFFVGIFLILIVVMSVLIFIKLCKVGGTWRF